MCICVTAICTYEYILYYLWYTVLEKTINMILLGSNRNLIKLKQFNTITGSYSMSILIHVYIYIYNIYYLFSGIVIDSNITLGIQIIFIVMEYFIQYNMYEVEEYFKALQLVQIK